MAGSTSQKGGGDGKTSPHPSRSPNRSWCGSQAPSPSRRRRGTRHSIVQRVIKEVGALAILTKANYNDWSLVMKVKLQARGLWRVMDFGKCRMALEAILLGLPPELQAPIVVKSSAQEAWEAIRKVQIGDDHTRKSNAQTIRTKYEQLCFNDSETVEDFAARLERMGTQLAVLGDPKPPEKLVERYLRPVPKRLNQVVVSMEEDVTSRLKAVEACGPATPESNPSSQLLLAEEQWLARSKERQAGKGDSNPKNQCRPPKGKKGGGANGEAPHDTSPCNAPCNKKCRNCGRHSHWARECRSLKREQ